MKAIVIGRHSGQIPGIEIVDTLPITFPAHSEECASVLVELIARCYQEQCALLFQAIPGQLAVALAKVEKDVPVGVIVSKPGERPAGKTMTVYSQEAVDAAKFANPNARVTRVQQEARDDKVGDNVWMAEAWEITVDPPMKFEFSHIEWF